MSKLNKDGAAAAEHAPYHRLKDDLRKSITDCVKAKTTAAKKELGTIDLLIASKITPEHFYCPKGMKVTNEFYEDTEYFQIKTCVIAAMSAAEKDLIAPQSVRGLGWTAKRKSDRTTAQQKIGSNMKDLRVSYETRIKKDTLAEIKARAEKNGMDSLTPEEVELISDSPIEQTTIDALRAMAKRFKKSAKEAKSANKALPYKVAINLNRIDAIEKDMLLVADTK